MAAFSFYPVYEIKTQELQELLDIFKNNPNSPRLEEVLEKNGFSRDLAQQLRTDTDLQQEVVQRLVETIRKTKEDWEDEWIKVHTDNIEKSLIENKLDLYTRSQLVSHPRIVKALQRRFRLPVNGNLDDFLENYRRTYYTRQCQFYGHTTQFCMAAAAEAGHRDVVEIMLERAILEAKDPLENLSRREQFIKGFNPKNARRPIVFKNEILVHATRGGHRDIVEWILTLGANDYDSALDVAATEGRRDMVELLIENGASDLNNALVMAAANGHRDIVELLIEKDAKDFNRALTNAAKNGHRDIVELLIESGADDYDLALLYAAGNGYQDIVELLLEKAINIRDDFAIEAINYAVRRGRQNIVDLIQKWRDTH